MNQEPPSADRKNFLQEEVGVTVFINSFFCFLFLVLFVLFHLQFFIKNKVNIMFRHLFRSCKKNNNNLTFRPTTIKVLVLYCLNCFFVTQFFFFNLWYIVLVDTSLFVNWQTMIVRSKIVGLVLFGKKCFFLTHFFQFQFVLL